MDELILAVEQLTISAEQLENLLRMGIIAGLGLLGVLGALIIYVLGEIAKTLKEIRND